MRIRDTLGRGFALVVGIGYGAGMMYLLDPQQGRRRRALIRDQVFSFTNDLQDTLSRQARNLFQQAVGSVAEARAKLTERQVDDEILEERVRAQLGHVVSHPGSLEASCHNGHVTITGPVLEEERARIEKRLSHTRGIHSWTLDVREVRDASSVPGLQGESRFQRKQRIG